MKRLFFFFICLYVFSLSCTSKTISDSPNIDLKSFFVESGAQYVLRNSHIFTDTLKIPKDSELLFDGGVLSGPIVFDNTQLSGNVKLKGSSLSGRVSNKQFDASWLCIMDGETDDAKSINEMIEVCGHVFFPRGTYRLKSAHNLNNKIGKRYHKSIRSHIGIRRSNVVLEGEKGTQFLTTDSLGTICLFSKPNSIDKSIRNIEIRNITFTVENDGINFHEFLHTIKTIGVNGLTIENCKFNDFWGDAICLSHYGDNPKTGERTLNQNVKILGNTINGDSHNNRNGISVISGKNVLIKGNVIKNTSRKDMPGGIDVEPNNSAYTIENIRIEKNYIEGVWGNAITLYINNKEAPAHHIEILSNVIKNSRKSGIAVAIKSDNTTDSIIIKSNHVHADTRPYLFRGNGKSKDWIISDNIFERPELQSMPGKITVKNLVVSNNKKKRMIPWVIENYWEYGILAILFVGMFFLYNRCRKCRLFDFN